MLTLDDLRAAHERIRPHVHRTPIMTSRAIDELVGAAVSFKCENFQRGGSFKIRGALNAVLSLPERDAARGVATHSSGNHGAALAIAAGIRGIPAYIVVPANAPAVKRAAIEGYGGIITECEPNVPARVAALNAVSSEPARTSCRRTTTNASSRDKRAPRWNCWIRRQVSSRSGFPSAAAG